MGDLNKTDVIICGSGSAGLMAALWLAKYGVPFRLLERRDGPLVTGQADGVQCRTVEIFESFGLSDPLLREAYHALELAFWGPDHQTPRGGIKRSHYVPDTEPGLSHQPHVILNQARINELITGEMLKHGGPDIDYGVEVKQVKVDESKVGDADAYPVTVTTVKGDTEEVFHAKYVLVSHTHTPSTQTRLDLQTITDTGCQGCDGAHSAVRKSLGIQMLGDSTDAIWGVIDLFPRTTFPDIRKKAIIQSTSGTLVIIPREGDLMVRFYIELPADTIASQVTPEDIHERAKLIFRPYELEIAETKWWSAYAVGQRLADHFHKQYRVFLTGDACHTHSPKAGQGMNVSLQDGYNIGWKLGAYLTGQATVDLVKTYVTERQQTAAELIEFDRNWSKIFKSKDTDQDRNGDANYMRDQFVKSGRYMAGQAYRYGKSIITWPPQEERAAAGGAVFDVIEGSKLVVGMRFPSAQIVRYSDAKVFQLLSILTSDRRWRVVVFAGDIQQKEVCKQLETVNSRLMDLTRVFTPRGKDPDSLIEPLLVLKTKRTYVELGHIPEVFKPVTGKYRIQSRSSVVFLVPAVA